MWSVYKIPPKDWLETYSRPYFTRVFGKHFTPKQERLSFALVVAKGDKITGYVTVREEPDDIHHWCFGGVMSDLKLTLYPFKSVEMCLRYEAEKERVKGVTLEVKNTNRSMLMLALSFRFEVIGTNAYQKETFVRLLREF